jgi:hypothetical protein
MNRRKEISTTCSKEEENVREKMNIKLATG